MRTTKLERATVATFHAIRSTWKLLQRALGHLHTLMFLYVLWLVWSRADSLTIEENTKNRAVMCFEIREGK